MKTIRTLSSILYIAALSASALATTPVPTSATPPATSTIVGSAAAPQAQASQLLEKESPSSPKQLVESKPTTVNGLTFVASTEAKWIAKKGNFMKRHYLTNGIAIPIHLMVTNSTKGDIVFPTSGEIAINLKTQNGPDIPTKGGFEAVLERFK